MVHQSKGKLGGHRLAQSVSLLHTFFIFFTTYLYAAKLPPNRPAKCLANYSKLTPYRWLTHQSTVTDTIQLCPSSDCQQSEGLGYTHGEVIHVQVSPPNTRSAHEQMISGIFETIYFMNRSAGGAQRLQSTSIANAFPLSFCANSVEIIRRCLACNLMWSTVDDTFICMDTCLHKRTWSKFSKQ